MSAQQDLPLPLNNRDSSSRSSSIIHGPELTNHDNFAVVTVHRVHRHSFCPQFQERTFETSPPRSSSLSERDITDDARFPSHFQTPPPDGHWTGASILGVLNVGLSAIIRSSTQPSSGVLLMPSISFRILINGTPGQDLFQRLYELLGDRDRSGGRRHRITWDGRREASGSPNHHGDAVEDAGESWICKALGRLSNRRIPCVPTGSIRPMRSTASCLLPWPASCSRSATPRRHLSASCIVSVFHQVYLIMVLYMPSRYSAAERRLFRCRDADSRPMNPLRDDRSPDTLSIDTSSESTSAGRGQDDSQWEQYITTHMHSEWKMSQYVSTLLIPIMFAILQMQLGSPIIRASALLALICGVVGLLLSCVFLVRIGILTKGHEVAKVWLKDSSTCSILTPSSRFRPRHRWWDLWTFLAVPVVWTSWSAILFIISFMCMLWLPSTDSSTSPSDNASISMAARPLAAACTTVVALGVLCFYHVVKTLSKFEEGST